MTETLTLVVSPPIITYDLNPLLFFSGHEKDLNLLARTTDSNIMTLQTKIQRFVRSPEGGGIGVLRLGSCETRRIPAGAENLQQIGCWSSVDLMVVLDGGKRTALYSSHSQMLVVYPSSPSLSIKLPFLSFLFSLPSSNHCTSIFGLMSDFTIIHVIVRDTQDSPELYIHSESTLPLMQPPQMIIPVDPMAWSDRTYHVERVHDVLLSIAIDGELAFWIPGSLDNEPWICTAKVHTARTRISMAKCSSSKKSALGKLLVICMQFNRTEVKQ